MTNPIERLEKRYVGKTLTKQDFDIIVTVAACCHERITAVIVEKVYNEVKNDTDNKKT